MEWVIYLKEEGRTGFLRDGRAALGDFPRVKPEGNPEEQPCQSEENPILPDSFTQIYILIPIGFIYSARCSAIWQTKADIDI